MPVAHRPRCWMNDAKVSACSPAIMARLTYRLSQPFAWISSAVSASSVIVSPEKPPASLSAVRRRIAAEPQKKAPCQRSRPRWMSE